MSAAPSPPLTDAQKQLLALAAMLDRQKDQQIRVALPGLLGAGMLCAAAYLIWRQT